MFAHILSGMAVNDRNQHCYRTLCATSTAMMLALCGERGGGNPTVLGQVMEGRDKLLADERRFNRFSKSGQLLGSCAAHHGRFVFGERSEHGSQLCPMLGGGTRVGGGKEAACRNAGCKPVPSRQPLYRWEITFSQADSSLHVPNSLPLWHAL